MAQRTDDQLSLAEALMHPGLGSNARLERIAKLIDWRPIAKALKELRRGERGAPPYPALQMFKALLLQQWYGLSDPGLEESLCDRLSFRRFVGLRLEDPTPDHATLWRFREALQAKGLAAVVFSEINRQLDALGLVVREGTMIDASLVAAASAPPPPAQGEQTTTPQAPDSAAPSKLTRSAIEPDAAWTRRGRRYHFGYKAHVAVDQHSELVRDALLTPANVNDTERADQLIQGDEKAVYADQAYDTKRRRTELKAQGIKDRIMHRPNKHQPDLPRWKALRNRLIGPLRARVETCFAVLKRHYGLHRARYFTLARNQARLTLACIAMNLRRALVLVA
jgi:IS5 family transposase